MHSASVEHSGGGETTVPPAPVPLPPEPPKPPFPLDDEVDEEDEDDEDDVPEDVVMTSEPHPRKTAKPKKDKPA
jgi:hypothetical protein